MKLCSGKTGSQRWKHSHRHGGPLESGDQGTGEPLSSPASAGSPATAGGVGPESGRHLPHQGFATGRARRDPGAAGLFGQRGQGRLGGYWGIERPSRRPATRLQCSCSRAGSQRLKAGWCAAQAHQLDAQQHRSGRGRSRPSLAGWGRTPGRRSGAVFTVRPGERRPAGYPRPGQLVDSARLATRIRGSWPSGAPIDPG